MARGQFGTFELSPRFSCDEVGIVRANRDQISDPQQMLQFPKLASEADALDNLKC